MKKLVVKNAPSESNLVSAFSVRVPRWYLLAIPLMVFAKVLTSRFFFFFSAFIFQYVGFKFVQSRITTVGTACRIPPEFNYVPTQHHRSSIIIILFFSVYGSKNDVVRFMEPGNLLFLFLHSYKHSSLRKLYKSSPVKGA